MPTTTTYAATGAVETFRVPAGVTSVTVDAYGGQGYGDKLGSEGGQGGRVQGAITVTPGETLYLRVGRSGANGGFNGGGRSGDFGQYGGGATDVRKGGDALTHRVLVAPGGGAAAVSLNYGGGHGGGLTGSAGQSNIGGSTYSGGGGGTQTAGGSGGNGGSGTLGVGQSSAPTENPGGGGGGGFYGGGAGASAPAGASGAGGGGGSALVPTGGTTTPGGTLKLGDGLLTLTYNQPPSAPILLTRGSLNRDAPNVLDWEHVDPDGDGQSGYDLRYRLVGATPWTTVNGSTPNSYREFAAGTFAAGDYEWQVRTYDTSGLVGAWSWSGFFTAATPPAGPSITAPVNGATVGTAQVLLEWTGTGTSWELRSVADADGTPDTATVLYTSGEQQVASVGRSWMVPLPVNSRYEHVQVREKASGLFGPWSSVRILVSYTLPGKIPGSVEPSAYALVVTAGSPTLTGGEPQIAFLELERGLVTDDGAITTEGFLRALDKPGVARLQVPVRGSYADGTVRSGVDYAYRWHAVAQNGTRSVGPWVKGYVDLGAPITDPVEPTVGTTV